jgi:D-tyrosyl-tRNA(Tyr) deacylase
VEVDGETVGAIDKGLLVFLGLDRDDDLAAGQALLDKLLAYRVFSDDQGRMNRSVAEVAGGVLLVSQFTLSADTRKGLRPGFSSAMPPADAEALFAQLLDYLAGRHPQVASGRFGADMQVSLVNDGPVTFLLETA